MFSHIVVGSNDLEASRKFYDATFGVLGAEPGFRDPKGRFVYSHNGAALIVTKPINGEPATFANGGTIGITMNSPELVKAWHEAGCANGGTSCENPPGVRNLQVGKTFLAYLRDPDGNKLCGVCPVGD